MALGGAERVVSSLAHGLLERGHDVAVSGAAGPLDAELPAEVRRLVLRERGRSGLGVVEWTALEAVFMRAFRPHVVHAHNAKATVIAAAAGRLARGPRRPPVLATHHGAAEDDRARAARLLERAADEVVSVSEDLLPAFSGAGVVTTSPSRRTSSTMTTQSAPSGSTPPVSIRAAVPGSILPANGLPAADSPTTRNGLPASADRTA